MLSLFIAIFALGNLGVEGCGERKVATGAIVGGGPVNKGDYPWQVSIRVNYKSAEGSYHTCGGTIISDQYILTANHCFGKVIGASKHEEYTIIVGNHHMDTVDAEQKNLTITKIIPHVDYGPITMDNDITLLKLASPLEFNDYIQPACLPVGYEYPPGEMTSITGWGDQETAVFDETLQVVHVPIIDNAECNQRLWYDGEVTANMFCAGFEEGGKDSCQGDSGGPVVTQNEFGQFEVIGITSWGYGCADKRNPGVYTRVGNYIQWINDNMV